MQALHTQHSISPKLSYGKKCHIYYFLGFLERNIVLQTTLHTDTGLRNTCRGITWLEEQHKSGESGILNERKRFQIDGFPSGVVLVVFLFSLI